MKNKIPDFAYHMTKFFTEYLPIQRNLSPNSIATYRDTFRLLLLFYDTEKHIKPNLLTLDMLDVQGIEDFMLWLKKERNCGASTCNQRLGALKSFFRYLQFALPDRALQCQGKFSHTAPMKQSEPG